MEETHHLSWGLGVRGARDDGAPFCVFLRAVSLRVGLHRAAHDVHRPRANIVVQRLRAHGDALINHSLRHGVQVGDVGGRRVRRRAATGGWSAHRRASAAARHRGAGAMAASGVGGIFGAVPARMPFARRLAEKLVLGFEGPSVGSEPLGVPLAVLASAARHASGDGLRERWLELRAAWRRQNIRTLLQCMKRGSRAMGSEKSDVVTSSQQKHACAHGPAVPIKTQQPWHAQHHVPSSPGVRLRQTSFVSPGGRGAPPGPKEMLPMLTQCRSTPAFMDMAMRVHGMLGPPYIMGTISVVAGDRLRRSTNTQTHIQ